MIVCSLANSSQSTRISNHDMALTGPVQLHSSNQMTACIPFVDVTNGMHLLFPFVGRWLFSRLCEPGSALYTVYIDALADKTLEHFLLKSVFFIIELCIAEIAG